MVNLRPEEFDDQDKLKKKISEKVGSPCNGITSCLLVMDQQGKPIPLSSGDLWLILTYLSDVYFYTVRRVKQGSAPQPTVTSRPKPNKSHSTPLNTTTTRPTTPRAASQNGVVQKTTASDSGKNDTRRKRRRDDEDEDAYEPVKKAKLNKQTGVIILAFCH